MLSWISKSEYLSREFERIRSEIGGLEPWIPRGWEYPWVMKHAELKEGMSLLDLGSGGSGRFPRLLDRLGMKVFAIDRDHFPCEKSNSSFIKGDIAQLPVKDNSIKRVFCVSVFEHIPLHLRKNAMREIERVLEPGGILLMTIAHFMNLSADRLEFLKSDPELKARGSNVFGNTDFKELLNWCHSLKMIDDDIKLPVPGFEDFNEEQLFENNDIFFGDYKGCKYAMVGLALEKE